MYLSAKDVKLKYKITSQTLYNWRKNGKIKYFRLPSGSFLYFPLEEETIKRKNVIYARVSNTKQKEDLDRQIKSIQQYMIANGIIVDGIFKDIASGMNEDRKEFNALIMGIINDEIEKIFISYKDRLTRFGYGYLKKICDIKGTEIVVLNSTKEEDFQSELTQDLVSIIHHFSMKMYSNRRIKLKELQKTLENK